VRTEEGKLYMLVAIDRVSKFAFAELREKATRRIAAKFLRRLIDAAPYKIHTVLTDNGTHFTTPGAKGSGALDVKVAIERGEMFRAHAFELTCARKGFDHRLTKPNHPWTNGQVQRMNRTLKEVTVRRYYYDSHDSLRPPESLPRRLQLRQAPQDAERPHALRIHPQALDRAAIQVTTSIQSITWNT
jgi:transposase InsO family protein